LILSNAIRLISVKRYQQALDLLIHHRAEYIGDPGYFHLLGDCYMLLGKHQLASVNYQEALKIDPNNVWIWLSMVNLKISLRDLIGAELLLEDCFKLDPNLPEVYAVKGEILLKKGSFDKSIEQFDRALQLDPNYAAALELKSAALSLKLKHSESNKVSNEALRLDPESSSALSIRAWNELLQGHQEEAESLFRDALRRDPLDELTLDGYKHALRRKSDFWRPVLDLELFASKHPGLQRVFVMAGYIFGFGVGAFTYLSSGEQQRLIALLTGLAVYLLFINFLPKVVHLLSLIPLMLHESAVHLMTKKEIVVATAALSIILIGMVILLAAFPFPEVRLLNGLLIILAGIYTLELKEKNIAGLPFYILLLLNASFVGLSVLFMYAAYQTSPVIVLLLLSMLIYPYLAKLFSLKNATTF
jgi:tetratricopeptide (TPR) repeat protein